MEGYQRVGVCGLLIQDGKALVVRRSAKEKYFSGYCELPGGRVEFGEHPDVAVTREFFEETGIQTEIIRPYSVFSYTHDTRHAVEVLYLLRPIAETNVMLSEEHDEYHWVTPEELERIVITPEMKENIKKGFAH